MKRRSLSLFLALLMVFGSVLPVFATEPAVEVIAEEETPAISYEDLYVDGAVFAWDAFGKTAEDVLDFGEGDTLVLGTYGDKELVLTRPSEKGTAVYGDGYLEITELNASAQLKIEDAYVVPGQNDVTHATYTTQMTIALLKNDGTITSSVSAVGRQYAVPFTSFSTYQHVQTFGMVEAFNLVNDDNMALVNAWSRAYLAAKNDASLQASFRTPISKAHYDLLAADATYKDHVFVVDGTDEDLTNDPVAAYSQTGYEADYTAFAYMLKTSPYNGGYYDMISYNPDTNAKIYASGVAKVTINTTAWMTDRDWKSSIGTLWTRKGLGEVATQTRINDVTLGADGKYTSIASAYVDDYQAVAPTTKPGTVAPTAAFTLAYGLDARHYAIRIYDKALSDLEMAQNHFADLCGYYNADLTKLALILNEDEAVYESIMIDLYNAASALSIGKTNTAAVEALIDAAYAEVAEAKKAIALGEMYVTDGLMYRWDAYNMEAFTGSQTISMYDKNGGDVVLSLAGVTYNAQYKVPETTNPYDFSKLISRTDGVYDEENLEFELVMTQTYTAKDLNKNSRPYIALGPIAGNGSGSVRTDYATQNYNTKYWNPTTYGGYSTYYYGLRGESTNTTINEKVTYYFDADGKRVDAPVDGGNSVVVTHHVKTTAVQICDQDWASLQRWVGNPVGESYSIGGTINFDLAEGAKAGYMNFQMYRDGLKIQKGGTFNKISYVPGYDATGVGTKIVPETYEQALEMTKHTSLSNTGYAADKGVFQIAGVRSTDVKLGYYAFRLYNRHLTDAERMQNHFADLCNYHGIDNILEYNALSDAHKAAIYTDAKFHNAKIDSRIEVSNTSFEDVTKEELEAAIDVYVKIEEQEKLDAEYVAKYEKLAELYVSGATAFWSAFGAKGEGSTVGVVADGAALAVSGGTSAYADGYLRAAGSTLTIANAYGALPADGANASYTTEMIYAAYDDGASLGGYTGEAKFTTEYGVIFGKKVSNTFLTYGTSTDMTYTDAAGRAMQEAWASAYVAAENDDALKATFWTPISEADYNSLVAKGMDANVRANSAEVPAVGAYSKTGYEADWDGFQHVISKSGLNRANFYHGYNYSAATKPGIGNSNIMKSDTNLGGSWAANYDFDNWGPEKGHWSRHDFGVVTSHTWVDEVSNDAGNYTVNADFYGDAKLVTSRTKSTTSTAKFNTNFRAYNFDADYYAIRIYPFALSEAERAQNHFADLASYHGIDNAEAFFTLNDSSKADLYESFASLLMKDTTKEAIEGAIDAAVAREAVIDTLAAEDYMTFEGYQVRKYDYAGLRSVYAVNKNYAEVEGVTLVEVGAIMAIADGRTVEDLTVAKTADGYKATGAQMANSAIYANGEWGTMYVDGGKSTFAYTCTFDSDSAMTAEKLTTDLIFRGYVVVNYDGVDFVLYTDMTSDAFGDSISMYEASTYVDVDSNVNFAEYNTSKEVIDIVEAE